MNDQYPSEEEYQQKLDEIREHDPNLYEYIMWGNSSDEPFDYDAMEVRLLLAIKEQEEEQKQSVGDLSNMTAMEIAERVLAQYGMGQEVHISGKEIADAMRYNPAKIDISGAGIYERKEIAPGKFINVSKEQPFTPAWFNASEYGAVGDGFIDDAEAIRNAIDGDKAEMSSLDNSDVDVLAIDDVDHMDTLRDWPTIKTAAIGSAIDWKKLETARNDEVFQQQMEQNMRDIAAVFGITLKELGAESGVFSVLQVAAERQRKELEIELLVGYKEIMKYRDELYENANSYAARCLYSGGRIEYYDMVYRLCAEGYSLEQALHGVQKQVGE